MAEAKLRLFENSFAAAPRLAFGGEGVVVIVVTVFVVSTTYSSSPLHRHRYFVIAPFVIVFVIYRLLLFSRRRRAGVALGVRAVLARLWSASPSAHWAGFSAVALGGLGPPRPRLDGFSVVCSR